MTSFANLATRTKLTVGFGIITVLLGAAIATSLVALRAERASDKSVQDILELRLNLNGQRASLLVALMLPAGHDQGPRHFERYSKGNGQSGDGDRTRQPRRGERDGEVTACQLESATQRLQELGQKLKLLTEQFQV